MDHTISPTKLEPASEDLCYLVTIVWRKMDQLGLQLDIRLEAWQESVGEVQSIGYACNMHSSHHIRFMYSPPSNTVEPWTLQIKDITNKLSVNFLILHGEGGVLNF